MIEATTGPDLKQNVVANAEGIGMTVASLADDTVKVPEQPEIASVGAMR
ncbi:MAG: hypothetical protein M1510_03975 [Nitrospirae bacterium]|nr:hypothetical protein [Nitrospirota bacterium]